MIPLQIEVHDQNPNIEHILLDVLLSVNDDFTPALSSWVSIPDYARKLSQKAVCWLVYEADICIGFAACYVNPAPKFSFWTMMAIHKDFRNRMAALQLEQHVITYCREQGSMGIHAEVDPKHVELIQLHRMFGFEVGHEQIVDVNRSFVPLTLTFKSFK